MSDKEHPKYRRIIQEEYPAFKEVPSIKLTENIILRANNLAERIVETFYVDKMDKSQSYDERISTEQTGILGEYVFARYYGFDRDEIWQRGRNITEGDNGYDFVVMHRDSDSLFTVDVKTTNCTYGNLLVPKKNKLRASLYFLIERRDDRFGIIGFTTQEKLQNAEIRHINLPTRFVSRDELSTPFEPFDIIPKHVCNGEQEMIFPKHVCNGEQQSLSNYD